MRGDRHISGTRRPSEAQSGRTAARFVSGEDGAILVLFAFMFVPMLIIIGFAMELALAEHTRVRLQNTADSASLASADLEQTLDATAVATDFFNKAGLGENLRDVDVQTPNFGERIVTVSADATVDALLTRLGGLSAWDVPVVGAAKEVRGDIEIALVLDNSGSMAWEPSSSTDPTLETRMDLLIPAAEAFVDGVQPNPGEGGTTTISLVPFATQVSVGADMLQQFNVSAEHSVSNCVTYPNATDFRTMAVQTVTTLQRTAHHDATRDASNGWGLSTSSTVCPTNGAVRDIYAWSQNAGNLKARIRAMQPYGFTSIEMGAKWGAALLDPAMQPVLAAMSALPAHSYMTTPAARGAPLDYSDRNSQKYLVIMSDGENTQSADIKAPYREGLSPVWQYDGSNNYSYYLQRSGTRRDYYRVDSGEWRNGPGRNAVQLTWPQVWARMSVNKFVNDVKDAALDSAPGFSGRRSEIYAEIVESPSTTWKNNRTSEICQAAKNNGITIFTIGMDTYGQGDATLADCASEETLFYDIVSEDIELAFEQIARQINQLRLTN